MNYLNQPSIIAGALVLSLFPQLRAQDDTCALPPLLVRGNRFDQPWSLRENIVGADALRAPDAASLVKNLPGAAIVRNGSQTGIVQLRGLSGDRVAVRVDGMAITPACPNHMDPPLHYAKPAADDLIELYAGISPVSEGGDHIGGSLSVTRARPEFADAGGFLSKGELSASYFGSQDADMAGADFTMANADASLRYRGSGAMAGDLRFPGGTVKDSGYDITHHELTGAWRTAGGYIAVDAGFSWTRDAGTPALPMDMLRDDAWHFGLSQSERFAWGTLESRLYVHDIDHLMDNHSLRPLMPGAMAMDAPATSRDYGWRGDVILPRGDDKLRVGLDFHRAEFDAQQVAVSTGMVRETFNDNRRSRAGLYLDWEREITAKWIGRIGVRGDVVASNADAVSNQIMNTIPIKNDRDAFNTADRSFTDAMLDATASVRFKPDENTGIELALAMKNRAPSLVERYLWTPANASAGLADGRTYMGNLGLEPETAFEIALGMTRKGERWNAGFTPFYQSVSDYIQGMPMSRLDSGGKRVLQYQNIDRAKLYGFEMTAGYDFNKEFSIDSTVSYVRGRSDETGGDLYRIAPLRGLVDFSYRHESWESHLEWVWADAQNHVAQVQDETQSPGYGLLNLRVAKTFADALRVELGVENLLDKLYTDHLGGVNRVGGGELTVGERIPGAGRFLYGSVSWKF